MASGATRPLASSEASEPSWPTGMTVTLRLTTVADREEPTTTSPAPAVDVPCVPIVPVGQEDYEASEEARGLVAPEATRAESHVIPQGLLVEKQVSIPYDENNSAGIALRRSCQVRRKPDRLDYK